MTRHSTGNNRLTALVTTSHAALLRDIARLTVAFYRWRFRHDATFTCASCAVSHSVSEATGAELRVARELATNHSRHGVYADRRGRPYALAVYGG